MSVVAFWMVHCDSGLQNRATCGVFGTLDKSLRCKRNWLWQTKHIYPNVDKWEEEFNMTIDLHHSEFSKYWLEK